MRGAIRLLASVLLVACSPSGPTGPDDLSFAYSDFAVSNQGCTGLVICLSEEACVDQACFSRCRAKSTARARSLFDAAFSCGQKWCLGLFDAGTAPCVISNGMLVDAQAGSSACQTCLENSLAALFGLPCPQPASVDCNPGMCSGLYAQCGANRP